MFFTVICGGWNIQKKGFYYFYNSELRPEIDVMSKISFD